MKIQLVEWKFKYKDEKSQTALCFKDYYTEQMKQKRTENNWKMKQTQVRLKVKKTFQNFMPTCWCSLFI